MTTPTKSPPTIANLNRGLLIACGLVPDAATLVIERITQLETSNADLLAALKQAVEQRGVYEMLSVPANWRMAIAKAEGK